ncbi:DUF726-domain-containing protein [Periconia macrospinosa]|uniref:DUF726-domain-containing protein n=1 Tax=Periconia macrospinosa TaxID=97972 RepID=A0A2V1DEQ6_9PLEO|nr:DUF726-domain-containing protein [Periconia macrospinosa]
MLYKVANVITGSGSDAAKQDEGASLTSVLETPALRVELAMLVLLCTDAMRSELQATFDPDKTHDTGSSSPAPARKPSPKPAVQDLISFDDSPDEAALTAERARRARQQEVESTQMQGLRRGALTFFDKWRSSVMHRICDVLCVRGEVVRQAKLRRKQMMENSQRERQGNSLLIDFDGDPFNSETFAKQKKKKHGHYDVIETKLLSFDEEKKVLILHCLLLLILSLENYSGHSRVLLMHLASSLELESDLLAEHERSVAQGLLATAASHMDAEETAKKQASNDAVSRKWKVGLAAVGGAVLIGVTGGLAAPLLAAGIGTVMGGLGLGVVSTYLGALAGSSVLVGSLFGAYGAKMTGRLMERYAKEVEDFEFIPVQDPERPLAQRRNEWADELDARDPQKREKHRLRVSIGISGWLSSTADVNKPWEVIDGAGTESFALRFELESMLRLGTSLNDVLFSYAWDGITYTIVSRTLLGALYAGLWPLGLVKVASVLDNPFSVALARADKAGKVLAHALIDGVQGKRPVTLMGYSIGARVIYACLVELAEQQAFGLVESAVLMGAPTPSDSRSWRQIRSVVAARVVNVYSTEDYILGFLYRSAKLQSGVAGLQEVKDVHGIENVDMSKVVNGHDQYRYRVGSILVKIGFNDLDFNKIAEQERLLEVAEMKKRQAREHVKRHKQETQQPDPSAQGGTAELVMVPGQAKPNSLINVSDNAPSQPARSNTQPPARRPFRTQNRSGQQPAQSMMPALVPIDQQEPPNSQPSTLDPLSGSIQVESHSPQAPSREPSFPVASMRTQRQAPSNMIPTPAAPRQRTNFTEPESEDEEANYKITMRDIDSQKFSPPLEEMLKKPKDMPTSVNAVGLPKTAPAVAVTEVESEAEGDTDDDEVGSEFGELSMVEPVPLED